MIRLAVPPLAADGIEAARRVLESGRLVQGPVVEQFERAVAAYTGARHAVAVSSGTAALHLSLMALGVGPGDAVAVPAYSFPATANVVEVVGAKPVFVDVDPATFNMDPACLAAAVAAQPLAAVIPVHEFGLVADIGGITRIAASRGIPVVEDAACALGASLDGRAAGTWGVSGCLSFHPRKVITTGEGGMVLTGDDDVAARVRSLRNHGLEPGELGAYAAAGLNYRMPDVLAALGVDQMDRLDDLLAARRAAAARYRELLDGTPFRLPPDHPTAHCYQSYVVAVPDDQEEPPFDVIEELRKGGVEANVGAWHLPLTPFNRRRYGHRRGAFPGADEAFRRALALPMHAALTAGECREVAHVLSALFTGPGDAE